MKTNPCPTRLLSDETIEEDAFSGSRQRIADSILDMIEHEEGGKTIGIEGNWGSGKSSIISLLQGSCQRKNKHIQDSDRIRTDSPKHFVFLFDAWAHEGNALRKTFVDELIGYFTRIKDQGTFEKNLCEKLENEKSDQLKNSTQQSSHSQPDISPWESILFVITTIVFSIGLGLISKGISILTFSSHNTRTNWELISGIITILSIQIFQIIINIFRIISQKKKINLWSLAVNQFRTSSLSVSTSENEVTSQSFQALFSSFLLYFNKYALKNIDKRKLIFIIDNLDRIEKSRAESLFSTIQTFFDIPQSTNLFKNVWIIIPYDKKGIKSIWESSAHQTEHQGDIIASSEIGKYMIEKRMQIIFHIPPIIILDFQSFFIKQLRIAFTSEVNHNEEELKCAYEVLRYFPYFFYKIKYPSNPNDETQKEEFVRDFNNKFNNPRQIKLLVNQIGAIHRQWEYPIPDILFFVLSKQSGLLTEDSKVLSIPDNCEHDRYLIKLLSDNYRGVFLSAWYNLEIEVAFQVLVMNNIQSNIGYYEKNEIEELAKKNTEYFWSAFNALPIHNWDIKWVINALYCLQDLISSSQNRSNHDLISLQQKFESRIRQKFDLFEYYDPKITPEAIHVLTSMNNNQELVDYVLNLISTTDYPLPSKFSTTDKVNYLFSEILNIITIYYEIVSDLKNQQKIPIDTKITRLKFLSSSERLIEFLAVVFATNFEDLFNLHRLANQTNEACDLALSNYVNINAFSDRHLIPLKFLANNGFNQWPELNRDLKSSIERVDNKQFLGERLEALKILQISKDNHAESTYRNLVNNKNILQHIENFINENIEDFRSFAWCIYAQFDVSPITRRKGSPNGREIQQFNKLRKFLDNPNEYKKILKWFVHILNKYGNLPKFISDFSDYWAFVISTLETLADEEQGVDKIISLNLDMEFSPLFSYLLQNNLLTNNSDAQAFIKSIITQIPTAEFEVILNNQKEKFLLLLDISDSRYVLHLGREFQEALEHIIISNRYNSTPILSKTHFNKLLKLLDESSKILLLKNLYFDFKNEVQVNVANEINYVEILTNNLPNSILLEDVKLISIVFMNIILRGFHNEIKWIRNILKNNKIFIDTYIKSFSSATADIKVVKREINKIKNQCKDNEKKKLLNEIYNLLTPSNKNK